MPVIVKRTATRRTPDGGCAFVRVHAADHKPWPGADAGDAVIWSTASVPADVSDAGLAGADRKVGLTMHGGSVFRVTELGPGFQTPMHRTLSLDYVLVLEGSLEIILDSGATVLMTAGDALVQRGTAHAWRNPSPDLRCRFLACMIEASPVRLGGRILPPTPVWKMVAGSLFRMLSPKTGAARAQAPTSLSSTGEGRRFVTGHDAAGRAIVISTAQAPIARAGERSGALVWATEAALADNAEAEPSLGPFADPGHLPWGTSFQLTELEPGRQTAMEQVDALVYGLVISGRLELQLEDGQTASFAKGDAIIQRATRHAWRNPDPVEPSRLALVQIQAQPIRA